MQNTSCLAIPIMHYTEKQNHKKRIAIADPLQIFIIQLLSRHNSLLVGILLVSIHKNCLYKLCMGDNTLSTIAKRPSIFYRKNIEHY